MNIKQIYEKYLIPENLQEHMLRVAALLQVIWENWQGKEIHQEELVLAGTLHDLANIIKFNFDTPLFDTPVEVLAKQKQIQTHIIEKYGRDIHGATMAIAKETGANQLVLDLIENMEWELAAGFRAKGEVEKILPIYADMRIGPNGILPILERLNNLQDRVNEQKFDWEEMKKEALTIEAWLHTMVKIDLNLINEKQLKDRFESLMGMEI
jgi:hypothetical protein